jgi:hypothetical protein
MVGIAINFNLFDHGRPGIFQSYSVTFGDPKRPGMHSRDLLSEPMTSLIVLKQNADALTVMNPPNCFCKDRPDFKNFKLRT